MSSSFISSKGNAMSDLFSETQSPVKMPPFVAQWRDVSRNIKLNHFSGNMFHTNISRRSSCQTFPREWGSTLNVLYATIRQNQQRKGSFCIIMPYLIKSFITFSLKSIPIMLFHHHWRKDDLNYVMFFRL